MLTPTSLARSKQVARVGQLALLTGNYDHATLRRWNGADVQLIAFSMKSSTSFDGEFTARMIRRFGFLPVRGSSSRGAVRGLLGMRKHIEAGWTVAFTIDGPRGPRFLTKPGPLVDVVRGAIEGVTGRAPALATTGGTSDARFIKDFCPVVEVGLRNATAHQVDEHVALADLAALTQIYRRFIERYFAA